MSGAQEDDKLFLFKEELFMRKWYAGCFKNMFFDTGLLNFLRVRCAINVTNSSQIYRHVYNKR